MGAYYLGFGLVRNPRSILFAPEVIPGLLQWDYSSAMKAPRAPPPIAPWVALRLTEHHRTAGHLEPRRVWASLSLFLSLLTAIILQGSVLKKQFFLELELAGTWSTAEYKWWALSRC